MNLTNATVKPIASTRTSSDNREVVLPNFHPKQAKWTCGCGECTEVIAEVVEVQGKVVLKLPENYDRYGEVRGRPLYAPGEWSERSLERSAAAHQDPQAKIAHAKEHGDIESYKDTYRTASAPGQPPQERKTFLILREELPILVICRRHHPANILQSLRSI